MAKGVSAFFPFMFFISNFFVNFAAFLCLQEMFLNLQYSHQEVIHEGDVLKADWLAFSVVETVLIKPLFSGLSVGDCFFSF